jgi:hypothetical protein
MSNQEILPPLRTTELVSRPESAAVTVSPPRIRPGGIIESTLTRWEAQRHARTIDAISVRTRAEGALHDAQTQLIDSYVKRQRAGHRLQELPEILANDRARRRTERADELRETQHNYELAELRRLGAIAHAETALVDAQQQLKAQRDHGYTTYELAWKKKYCDLLDVELSTAERRAILRQHMAELEEPAAHGLTDQADDAIDDALYEKRAELNASGLDTSKIDAELERRKSANGRGEG